MPKKVWLAVILLAVAALAVQLPVFCREVALRGPGGVNYGRVGFPLLLLVWAGFRWRRR